MRAGDEAVERRRTRLSFDRGSIRRKKIFFRSICSGWLILTACASVGLESAHAARAEDPRNVEIRIEGIRPRMTAGAGLGVTATVTNISNSMVYLHEKHITMVPPPELVGDGSFVGWWAYFPTEFHTGQGDDY